MMTGMRSESAERSERRAADGTELSAAQTEAKRRLFQLSHLESELVKSVSPLLLFDFSFLTFKHTLSTKKMLILLSCWSSSHQVGSEGQVEDQSGTEHCRKLVSFTLSGERDVSGGLWRGCSPV